MQTTILIVDDELAIREMIKHVLELQNFYCLEAENSTIAYELIVERNPELVLLDWMLPQVTGIELLRRLQRDKNREIPPVIMLTAKDADDNKVQGLTEGADDYITKPFSPRELIARVNAVLRRSGKLHQSILTADKLSLDSYSHRVYVDNEVISIGPTEYRLLLFFLTHPDRVYTRGQLLDQVWGGNIYIEERTVDVHIRRLRKALRCSNGYECAHLIQTIRGAGYRFSVKV